MARYLARSSPRCNRYVGIVIREPGRNMPVQLSTVTAGVAYVLYGLDCDSGPTDKIEDHGDES